MERISFISQGGKKIIYMDFSGLREFKDINPIIESSKEYIRAQAENSAFTLTNMDGMHFNSDIKNAFSSFIGDNKPYVKAGAVIGLSGLLRIIYNGVNRLTGRDIKSFDTKEEAVEWLVSK
ncbi:STAS/SEC14 domain-containing protein [Carboxylicivirga sp. N1Y90]|uniref:STAS/SEC14 domain-containing protein n=1 Tax=Carboxylicivirga fragile TaxID=3417571 RepID=UPI003D3364A4|nr:hypothetical protein [Marinilabiliaceae bacterium N1Y90]